MDKVKGIIRGPDLDKVKGIILKDSSETWPPQSAKHSVNLVIDVQALNAIVNGSAPSTDA